MKVIQLLSFSINNTAFYFTNAGSDFNYGLNVYKAGFWDGLDSFEQRSSPAINEHSISISDPDLTLTINALSGLWQWQSINVRWLILENDIEVDNFLVLQASITMHDTDDDKKEITFRVQENHTLELATGHRTSNASQHLINPNDDCFELIPFLDGLTISWGKEGNGVVRELIAQNGYSLSPRYNSPD